MRPSRAERRRRGSLRAPRRPSGLCLVELLAVLAISLALSAVVALSLYGCLSSPRARLAVARRESQALALWLNGAFQRALRERRVFRLTLPAGEPWDFVELHWQDSGERERFSGHGRLQVQSAGSVSQSVYSPTFQTLSPAFSLRLYAPPVRAVTEAFGYLILSAHGRVRFSERFP